jgi:hypothetical protein
MHMQDAEQSMPPLQELLEHSRMHGPAPHVSGPPQEPEPVHSRRQVIALLQSMPREQVPAPRHSTLHL